MIHQLDGKAVHSATGGLDPFGTDGPLVVLVHGAGMDSSAWFLQTRWLGHRGLRSLAVDLPGHGRSEGNAPLGVAEAAGWLGQFVASLDLGPATIVGHSLGTFVAMELAARRPDLVSSLVLLGTADSMGVHPELLAAAANDLPRAAALMASWGHAPTARLATNPTPGLWMTGGARALVEISRPGVLHRDLTVASSYRDALDTAGSLNCPVTVVAGAYDKMTPPRAAAKLYARLEHLGPRRQWIQLEGVGHMMMTEDPGSVRTIIRQASSPTQNG